MDRQAAPPYMREKLLLPEELLSWRETLRKEKKRLATLNGSFDLLHAGHLHILFEAKQQADILLVALNSDSSIARYKSKDRPIISLPYRLQMMSSLQFVDFVTWFEEDDPRQFLRIVKPDVHVNGADWGYDCIEAPVVKEVGARLHIVSLKQGLSTSRIISKIHETCSHV